ncbi:serine hydrolase [Kitasatospora sp. YST-16]|uniref:serine hydrolase domain-containing protein n=1 Tax=Kitasatospora sp. YST-16 TaxID=2998080 RepID=UPI0022833CFD|nr:serine hydrolase domain-containing protein [Kitasatospora sp. YST-16]WAL74702.1 serine hydrolase [Kitasatospora sp. YST-16]WNW40756.1 serine hydrolase domain-containing protein [Streptomyces sp. Li-HN-5-13]
MNAPAPHRTTRRLRLLRHATAATAAAGLALTAFAPTAATAAPRPDAVQQRLDALVRADGVPAALATVKGRDGRDRTYTAGVGDLATGAKVPVDGQIRAGSNTKAFTAVVVLQLVAEGKVGLDASVDTYLPGLLRGDGIDGRTITVRQLLQHTSGLPDYMDVPPLDDFVPIQYRYFEPRELLDGALAQKALFAPGTGWMYSNTNYLVAGLLVQKVTGRPFGEEVTKRVIDRIGLRHTYFPATGETALREAHPHGYLNTGPGAPLIDYTGMDASMAWSTGAIVSTNTDLNTFYSALLAGRLLPAAQLAQMRTTVPAELLGPGVRYGLGLQSRPLTCGGLVWGHGGTSPGYRTRGGATEDGRAATITVTTVPDGPTTGHLTDAVDTALCR